MKLFVCFPAFVCRYFHRFFCMGEKCFGMVVMEKKGLKQLLQSSCVYLDVKVFMRVC